MVLFKSCTCLSCLSFCFTIYQMRATHIATGKPTDVNMLIKLSASIAYILFFIIGKVSKNLLIIKFY